jgi:hypothetical protein
MKNPFKRSFTLDDVWSGVIMIFVIGGCFGISILGWMVLWYIIKWLWGVE